MGGKIKLTSIILTWIILMVCFLFLQDIQLVEAVENIRYVNLCINGKEIVQPESSRAFVMDARTMVPLRLLSEELGAKIGWNSTTQEITITSHAGRIGVLTVGSKILKITTTNGQTITKEMDIATPNINGKTFAPLRFVLQDILEQEIGYDSQTSTVIVNEKYEIQELPIADDDTYYFEDINYKQFLDIFDLLFISNGKFIVGNSEDVEFLNSYTHNYISQYNITDLINNLINGEGIIVDNNTYDISHIQELNNVPYLNLDLPRGVYIVYYNDSIILYISNASLEEAYNEKSMKYYKLVYPNTLEEDNTISLATDTINEDEFRALVKDKFYNSEFYTVGTREPCEYLQDYVMFYKGCSISSWLQGGYNYLTTNAVIIDDSTSSFSKDVPSLKKRLLEFIPEIYDINENGIYVIQNGDATIIYIKAKAYNYQQYVDYMYDNSDLTFKIISFDTNREFENVVNEQPKEFILESYVDVSGNLTGTSKIVYFEADPEKGFNYPYVIILPSNQYKNNNIGHKRYLVVEPNNFGRSSDNLEDHIVDVVTKYKSTLPGSYLAEELWAPRLMPIFPRPYLETNNTSLYTHSLDSTTVFIENIKDILAKPNYPVSEVEKLVDLETQMYNIIEDAKSRLNSAGYDLEEKVFMVGFSASGNFVNRYTTMFPGQLKATYSGGVNTNAIIPAKYYKGQELIYPVGVAEHKAIIGREFSLEEYNQVAKLVYMGAKDTNNTFNYKSPFDKDEKDLIINLFGEDMFPTRWNNVQKAYFDVGGEGIFLTNLNAAHGGDISDHRFIVEFFKSNRDNIGPNYDIENNYENLLVNYDNVTYLDSFIKETPIRTTEGDLQQKFLLVHRDPSKGFNFPYLIFKPTGHYKNIEKHILVEAYNTPGSGVSNDLADHIEQAKEYGYGRNRIEQYVADELNIFRVMPIIPRYQFSNPKTGEIGHSHGMDIDTMFIADNIDDIESTLTREKLLELDNLEEQILTIINDAQERLRAEGYKIKDKIFIAGFSAAGSFSSKFTSFYPEKVKAMFSGGMHVPFVPANSYKGTNLIYGIGTYDHQYLNGKPFNLEDYNDVAKIMYLGAQDSNDPLPYNDVFSPNQRIVALRLYGNDYLTRWNRVQDVFFDVGGEGMFITSKSAEHNYSKELMKIVAEFFMNNIDSDIPWYFDNIDSDDLTIN